MNRFHSALPVRLIAAFLAVCCCVSAETPAQKRTVVVLEPRQLSIEEYISELDHLSALAKETSQDPDAAADALASLRGGWKVTAGDQTFGVPTGQMYDAFEKVAKNPDEQTRKQLLAGLEQLEADAIAYQQPAPDSTSAHTALTQILARSEFRHVHGATWWDRLKYRVLMWIFRQLNRFFGSSAAPTVGKIFVWSLVAIAVLVLAYFIFRTLQRNAKLESAIPQVTPVSAKGWRIWLEEAHVAASQGLWRDAVHLTYWAGISFLETSGTWRPDKARTPREYLRLLSAGSEHRSSLSALTRNLELTWYGSQPAGPETFSESLSLLERLGCPQA